MDTNNYTLMGMADADYQYKQFETASFIIDRSDSMDADYIRVPTEPKVTIIKGHKVRGAESVGANKWVDTYDKFLNTLFVFVFGFFMMSCTTDVNYQTQDSTSVGSLSVPKILEGHYEVSYKIHESADGSTMLFSPHDVSERDGAMAEMKLEFTADSLHISQLMSNGWVEGAVKLKWKNGIPTQVGCREVVYATENEIHWMQNDVIIKNYLIKL